MPMLKFFLGNSEVGVAEIESPPNPLRSSCSHLELQKTQIENIFVNGFVSPACQKIPLQLNNENIWFVYFNGIEIKKDRVIIKYLEWETEKLSTSQC